MMIVTISMVIHFRQICWDEYKLRGKGMSLTKLINAQMVRCTMKSTFFYLSSLFQRMLLFICKDCNK